MPISFLDLAARLDPVRPPRRLRGAATPDDLDWYATRLPEHRTAIHSAIRRFAEPPVGLQQDPEKGLEQLCRWRPDESRRAARSLRRISRRLIGADARAICLLAYNTWLIEPDQGDRARRLAELGPTLRASGIDLFALCEVFNRNDGEGLADTRQFQFARGPERKGAKIGSGLQLLVRRSAGRIVSTHQMRFDRAGGLPDSMSRKGVLHVEVDVGPGRIDLFQTHMFAKGADEPDQRSPVREAQTRELLAFIRQHRQSRNPVIVVGDFNVDGRKREYEALIRTMAGIGLRDAWLTYGCRRGATTEVHDFEKICVLDAGRVYCRDLPQPNDPEPPLPASDNIPGYRLDYIFVESPTNQHAITVAVSRIRRRPFWRGGRHSHTTFETGGTPNFLSDHLGLEVTLLVSPAGGAS